MTWNGAKQLPRISPNEYTAASPLSQASGATSAVTVPHGLGVKPSVVVGHLEDGSWSGQFGWWASMDATNVIVGFLNQGPNVGNTTLRFRLIY